MRNFFKDLKETFIIAELSANHNGSLSIAKDTIKAAKRAGANAIKLQTYTADTLTLNVKKKDFIIQGKSIWSGQNLYDLYKSAYTPWDWHEELFKIANDEGLICFSSPFDTKAVDLLESLGNPIYKIASFEITDIPLIEYIASKGKPIIISSGISTIEDIDLAIEACYRRDNDQLAILKCTSSYPAPIDEANLCMISDIENRFGVISGLSDHTLGITAPIVAITQGAKIIEKHFILDRKIGGPDASFSLNENEFSQMVNAIREAEVSLGKVDYSLTKNQLKGRNFCRSLYLVEDVKKGDIVTTENVRSVRPGYGLHPKYYSQILGKKFKKDSKKGDRMSLNLLK